MEVGSPQELESTGTASAAALVFNGAGGPVPWRNRRTALSTLWARATLNPSQSILHDPRIRDLIQPSLSRDTKVLSETIRRLFCSRR